MREQDDRVAAFRRCMPPAALSSRTRGTSAARVRSSSWASRRWQRRAPASPGRLGRADNSVDARRGAGASAGRSPSAVDVPVNADFEGGFAVEPEQVGANVKRAVATGIAGLSIEDSTGDPAEPLFDSTSPSNVSAPRARRSTRAARGVLLTGRSEGFIVGRPDLDETIRRLKAYAEAGADCLYAPRHRHRGRGRGGRRRRGAQAGEPLVNSAVHHGRGGWPRSASAGSASAARSRARRGPASWRPHRRSRTRDLHAVRGAARRRRGARRPAGIGSLATVPPTEGVLMAVAYVQEFAIADRSTTNYDFVADRSAMGRSTVSSSTPPGSTTRPACSGSSTSGRRASRPRSSSPKKFSRWSRVARLPSRIPRPSPSRSRDGFYELHHVVS